MVEGKVRDVLKLLLTFVASFRLAKTCASEEVKTPGGDKKSLVD